MVDASSSNSTTGSASTPGVILYDREYRVFMNVVGVLLPPLLLFGLIANPINIVVFSRAGLKNSVNICLLALSISDLIHLILSTPQVSTMIIYHFRPDWPWPFHLSVTSDTFYWPASTFYDMSAFFSVFLSAMRCACVAMPLRFKSLFTWKRTRAIVCCLAVCAVILRVPMLSSLKIVHYTTAENKTEAILTLAVPRDVYSEYTRVNDLVNRGVIPWTLFIIIVMCTTVLVYKLSEAAKFRKTSSGTTPFSDIDKSGTSDLAPSHPVSAGDSTKLSGKDIQVVQSVVLVSVIFILSQVPFLSYSLARQLNSEFSGSGQLQRLFTISARTSTTCGYINASVNIIIYYNYHTKYKQTFRQLFRMDKK